MEQSGAEVATVSEQLQERVDALTNAAQTWEQVTADLDAAHSSFLLNVMPARWGGVSIVTTPVFDEFVSFSHKTRTVLFSSKIYL